MRIKRLTTRFSLGAGLGLVLAAAVMAVPAPAQAADDNVPLDTQIFRKVMKGLGFKSPDDAEITYQERAPLVIPPDKDLPPPQRAGAAIANNPAWPKDPDVARAKVNAVEDKDYGTTAQIEREENPLSPSELAPNAKRHPRAARNAIHPADNSREIDYGYSRIMKPKELGFNSSLFETMFGNKDNEAVRFTGEPARAALTDPPPGYQVPSPAQPYGLGKGETAPKAEDSYVTRSEMKY